MTTTLLDVKGLCCTIGGVRALHQVDLEVDEGSITGIVGPNGAGKTTLFNAISGFCTYQTGDVTWQGSSIRGWKAHRVAATGLLRTFQNVSGFSDLTVEQNVTLACRGKDPDHMKRICRLLDLDRDFDRAVESCSLATRKLVGIAMAAVRRPRLLMLDEPMSGLDLEDRDAVIDVVKLVHNEGVTVLLIEHDIERAMALVDHLAILDLGEKVAEGTPESLAGRPELHNAYLKA